MASTYDGIYKNLTRDCAGGEFEDVCPYYVATSLVTSSCCVWGMAWKRLRKPPGRLRKCQLRQRTSPRHGEDRGACLPVPHCQMPMFKEERDMAGVRGR